MKIGIIGSGNVGGTLGTRWAKNGHDVVFSTRGPVNEELKSLLAKAGDTARSAPVEETARAAEVILLATPANAAEDALRSAANLSGKVLIDATNPLLPDLSGLTVANSDSQAERVARWASGARVVKSFNTVGADIMANPTFSGGPVAMFYCGDDRQAKETVAGLIGELGFEALDAGPLSQARVLEPFAMLWISLAVKYGYGRDIAFRLLRR